MKDVIFDEQKQTEKSSYNPDVLSCLANLSNDEVFTPPEVANAMLDMLPQEIFSDKNAKFFDPACKSGVFLREIAKRLLVGLEKEIPDLQERVTHIFKKQLFAIAITELTSLLSRRSVYCSKDASGKYSVTEFTNSEGNIFYKPAKHLWINGKCLHCGASQKEYGEEQRQGLETHAYQFIHNAIPGELENMKFDVIIGNPPYQLSTGGSKAQSVPIYDKFVFQAIKLKPRYLTMIIPARWYAGGMGLDKFRKEMLSKNRLKTLVDFPNAEECFPGIQLRGGCCYFLWEKDYSGKCHYTNIIDNSKNISYRNLSDYEIFIRYNQSTNIIEKIKDKTSENLCDLVSSVSPFGFGTSERGDTNKFDGCYSLYTSQGIFYIKKNKIKTNISLADSYKVMITRPISGNMEIPPFKVIALIKTLRPREVCTHTYLTIGSFKKEINTHNLEKYLNTRFLRFLLVQSLSGLDISKEKFRFVPLQDFTSSSDIDWTKSIPEIDTQLYKKYELSEEEIKFIESMIRPME